MIPTLLLMPNFHALNEWPKMSVNLLTEKLPLNALKLQLKCVGEINSRSELDIVGNEMWKPEMTSSTLIRQPIILASART